MINLSVEIVRNATMMAIAMPFYVAHETTGFMLDVLLGPEEDPWQYIPSTAGGPIPEAS